MTPADQEKEAERLRLSDALNRARFELLLKESDRVLADRAASEALLEVRLQEIRIRELEAQLVGKGGAL